MPRSNSSSASKSASSSECSFVNVPAPSRSLAVAKCRSRIDRESSSALSRSPLPAARPIASNWSVTRAMALTTTTGLFGRRSRTIAAARSMAAASSTEVPPNFITIMPALQGGSFRQVPVGVKKLGIQQGSTGGAADHIVREHGELPVEKIAGAQAADRNRHTGTGINIEPRLWTVGSGDVDGGLLRRVREALLLRQPAKVVPRGDDLIGAGFLLQFDRDRFRVPIFHRHAVTLRADHEISGDDTVAVERAQHLARLFLHLFF